MQVGHVIIAPDKRDRNGGQANSLISLPLRKSSISGSSKLQKTRVDEVMTGRRHRRQFRQTDGFVRGRIVGLRTAGWSYRRIAAETRLDASTVYRIWTRWVNEQNANSRIRPGPSRWTTERTDRHIRRAAMAAPQSTSLDILRYVPPVLDAPISARTVA